MEIKTAPFGHRSPQVGEKKGPKEASVSLGRNGYQPTASEPKTPGTGAPRFVVFAVIIERNSVEYGYEVAQTDSSSRRTGSSRVRRRTELDYEDQTETF